VQLDLGKEGVDDRDDGDEAEQISEDDDSGAKRL